MKIENQLCTILQGKRLKELGITAEAYLYWCVYCPDPIGENYYYLVLNGHEDEAKHAENIAPAYSVAELGVMLPEFYSSYRYYNEEGIELYKSWNDDTYDDDWIHFDGSTEAEARASMLIYLLENKIVTPEEINERLKNA